eukprot:NODE_489_length_6860_cov_1.209289.p4 type:complete len:154 gc:universal NODE_489_length_6860_cov_1.209289:5399-4938(-)
MKLFIHLHINHNVYTLNLPNFTTIKQLYSIFNLQRDDSTPISAKYQDRQHISISGKLLGGKGGFIAQLKKEGSKMKSSENTDKLRTQNKVSGKTMKLLDQIRKAPKEPEKKEKKLPKPPQAKALIKDDTIDEDRKKEEALLREAFRKKRQKRI